VPIKTFADGEEVDAEMINTYLANQVVPTFTDAAQRNVQLPSPDKGQLSALDSYAGALWIWTGSAWVEPTPYTQSGYHTQTTNGAGGGIITYPKPFAAGNVAIHMTNAAEDQVTYGMQFGIIKAQNLAAECGFLARYTTGAVAMAALVELMWTATGYRAPD
jgi:hypothetical protein